MKKLLFVFLTLVLVVSVFAIPANAASGSLEVTPSSTEAHPGDTVSFTLKLNNPEGKSLNTVQVSIESDQGDFTIQYEGYEIPCKDDFGAETCDFFSGKVSCAKLSGGVTKDSLTLLTFNCKVDPSAKLGTKTLTFKAVEVKDESSEEVITKDTEIKATVKVTHTEHKWPAEWKDDPENTANCEKAGKEYQECETEGCGEKQYRDKAALGHDWEDTKDVTCEWGEFDFSNVDGKTIPTATYKVKCDREGCEYHSEGKTENAVVTEENRQDPQCETPGKVDYKAVVTVSDGEGTKTYTDATSHKEVTIKATGHDWGEVSVDWEPNDGSAKPSKATATVTCGNGDQCETKTMTVTVQGEQISEKGKDPTCTEAGNKTYSATFTFDHNGPTGEQELVIETIPATGHKWGETATFTWGEDGSLTKVTAPCSNSSCPDGQTVDLTALATVTHQTTKEPDCVSDGTETYHATVTAPGGAQYGEKQYDSKTSGGDKEVTLTKLGHDYANPTFDWKGSEEDDYKGTTVTWTCTRDEGHTQQKDATITKETVKANYERDGSITWTAEAEADAVSSPDKITPAKATDTKVKVLTKLEPETTADVQTPAGVKTDAVAEELTEQFDTLVKDALTAQTAPAGMPKEVFEAIKLAGESETDGSLSVSTNLVVEQPKTEPTVTGVDAASVLDAYDIRIEMTVTGDKLDKEVTGYITETAELITFTLPKPTAGGPIFYMMTDHGGTWKRIDSTVQGSSIVFSTQEFSNFVIVGSNSLADAEVADIADQAYTGSALEPDVKVTINGGATTLVKGTDYEVVYENNTAAGTAKVTIKGIGSYTGELTAQFTILPPAATARPNSPAATKDPNVPATGDETPLALYATALVVCAAALGLVLVLLRRRHEK